MCEMPSCYRETKRKARKEHKCCECRIKITAGTEYMYKSGVWDGNPQDYKMCMNCHEIQSAAESLARSEQNGPPAFENLKEWFYEYYCSDFSGQNFLHIMAKDCGLNPDNLNRLLKVEEMTQR